MQDYRRWARLLICLSCLIASGCRKERGTPQGASAPPATQPAQHAQLTIAAAADLKFALEQIVQAFHKQHPDASINVSFGSSGNFYSQLSNKAPFDVFLSADASYPDKLVAAGIGDRSSEFPYAVGRIVIWVPNNSALDIPNRGFDALRSRDLRKLAIANPQHAPYGRAAEAALKAHHAWDELQGRIVLGENIAQTAQFVQTGSVDAGIIALSLALAPSLKSAGRYYLIPQSDHPPIRQAGLILPWARDRGTAEAFRDFITGPEGRSILKAYGFEPPG